jgi:enoyl-CoA hydratase/carnithine racemase
LSQRAGRRRAAALNRADKRNADRGDGARDPRGDARPRLDDEVVVIVVEGTDGAFCAGADMAEAMAAYEAGETASTPR